MKWVFAEDWPSETPPPWGFGEAEPHPPSPARPPTRRRADGAQDVHRGDPRGPPRGDDPRRDVIVLGEDVGKKGGVFLATDGLWAEFGDDRVIDTPLTESQIIGTSIGAAIGGLRPVAEIQFADFIHPAFNQLVSEAARLRYRSNNGYGAPMVVRAPYGGGVHGALYHSQSVEAFFTHVPGLKVVIPSTPYDAKGLLRSSIRDEDPVLFFEHKKMYRSVRGDVPDGEYTVPLGKAQVTHPGTAGHGHRLRPDGPLRARGGRPRRRRGDQRRGRRPPDAPAARQGDRPRLGPQDRQVPGRLRGQPVRRLRRGGRGDRRRGGVRLPRRAGDADRRARTCPACRTTTSSRSGSWSTRRRSPTGSGSLPPTEAELAALRVAAPGVARSVPRPARAGRGLRPAVPAPPGRHEARLVRRREPGQGRRPVLAAADVPPPGAARRVCRRRC